MNTHAPTTSPIQKPSKPFPAWRLPNGTIKASDDGLEESIGSCERWEWFGGGLVVAGVVAAVVIAAIHPKYDSFLEQWGSVIADGLVAIGVAIEIKFGQMAGLRQGELKRRSNDELAAAQSELARIKSTRRQILARPGNADAFVESIKAFAGTRFDIAHGPEGHREQWDFLWDIEPLFIKAGWQFVDWRGGTFFAKVNDWNGRHSPRLYGVANVLNIEVEVAPANLSRLMPAASALVDALNKMGIEATPPDERLVSSTSINADVMHFLVGEKR